MWGAGPNGFLCPPAKKPMKTGRKYIKRRRCEQLARLGFPPQCANTSEETGRQTKERTGESPRDYAHRVLSIPVKGLKYAIPVCVRELGIDVELPKRHSAMHDAYATHLIYEALKIVA